MYYIRCTVLTQAEISGILRIRADKGKPVERRGRKATGLHFAGYKAALAVRGQGKMENCNGGTGRLGCRSETRACFWEHRLFLFFITSKPGIHRCESAGGFVFLPPCFSAVPVVYFWQIDN